MPILSGQSNNFKGLITVRNARPGYFAAWAVCSISRFLNISADHTLSTLAGYAVINDLIIDNDHVRLIIILLTLCLLTGTKNSEWQESCYEITKSIQ